MIVVDASALMAILQREAGFEICMDALAEEHGCPLLYVGGDFRRTDLVAPRPVR